MRIRENQHLQVIKNIDIILILTAVSLSIYGIVVVSSATNYLGAESYIKTQLTATLLGIVAMCVISFIDYEALAKKMWGALIPFSAVLLILPKIFGSSDFGGSNENWITIPIINFNFQPSEFVKILFIIALAFQISNLKTDINRPTSIIGLGLHILAMLGCLMFTGDLGATIMYTCIAMLILFSAGLSLWYFAGVAFAVLAAAPVLWGVLSEYQRMRILVGFDPYQDPEGYGYQVIQSIKAISNGGFTGMGYRNGVLTQNPGESALPARQTDMILAPMGEEFGFLGILFFFALMILLVIRILKTAKNASTRTGSYICIGVAAIFIAQTLENVGMCLGLLPVIGITLPFVSYGGSSVLALYLCIGAVVSIGAHKKSSQLKF